MPEFVRAKEPFNFYTRLNLPELTGLRASTIGQLLALIKKVPGSCIYHHTHRFLQQHLCLSPEPPNDFAYWVAEVLGEDELGEQLASLDIVRFSGIESLRDKITSTVEEYLKNTPTAKLKFASEGQEFHFIKSLSFIMPTKYIAYDLKEFADIIKLITIDSIYFHIFESRLRLERGDNDFSNWIEFSTADKYLANKISRIDPYSYSLEGLREALIKMIEARISA